MLTYAEFTSVYGDSLTLSQFNRFIYDAEAEIRRQTTGLGNFSKLDKAFPTKEADVTAIKRCLMALVDAIARIETAESASIGTDGSIGGSAVSARSSGSESITYANGASSSALAGAVASTKNRDALFRDICKKYLSGHCDKNGVNLLYMG